MNQPALTSLLLFLLATMLAAPSAAKPGWSVVKQEGGVTVWMLQEAGKRLPLIRARTRVAAEPAEVLAVIRDVDASCAWAGRCMVSRLLHRDGPHTRLYSRRSAPWPITDRDFELLATTKAIDGGRLLRVEFRQAVKARTPLPSGVVRMPVMRGHYQLRAADGGTDVELQIEADPGGWIPDWILRWTAKNGPFASLSGLRKRVPKVRGRYAKDVAELKAWAAMAGPPAQP